MKEAVKFLLLGIIAIGITLQTVATLHKVGKENAAAISAPEIYPEVVLVQKKVWSEFTGMGGSYVYVVSPGRGTYEIVNLPDNFKEGEFLQRMPTRGGMQYAPITNSPEI